ncbi:hypothetical protein SAMN04487867_10497 [Vreelandella titanicae]|uniref:hypothetical protein n=1 Tax=Vreelandella titanicae TaxID=664683 RepID=UPI000882631F|nr:hypothetical protein [Halomonas titanicae]SDI28554.1 hypothetical protein SAMN04487867_10497 [Halomonas titanicae]
MRLKLLAVAAAALTFSGSALAQSNCYGSDSYQTCRDTQTGNNYNIQRYGNTTNLQGNNPSTGSSWNQNSQSIGNTTYHRGNSASGNSWNGTSTQIGGTTIHRGIDSDGNMYNKTCNQFGCN